MNKIKESTFREAILAALQTNEMNQFLHEQHYRIIRSEDVAKDVLKSVKEMDETQKHNKKLHILLWSTLSACITQSFPNTELRATAYDRRSEFYFHIKKYEASIYDIEKAQNCTKLSDLEIKLLCRKIMCLIALQKPIDDSLNKAKFELQKIQNRSKKKDLKLLVDTTQVARNNYVFKDSIQNKKKNTDLLKTLDNKENEDISESVIIE